MTNEPLVTVYIPTKDRPVLLERALESVARQTYQNIEVIVCDDGSEVSLDGIRQLFQTRFRFLVWMRNERPSGAPMARNRMIEAALGDYITGLDDDDYFLPSRVESFVEAALTRPEKYFSTSIIRKHGADQRTVFRRPRRIDPSDLNRGNLVGNQVFVQTNVLRQVGGFDPELRAWQDYDLWYRLSRTVGPGYRLSEANYVMDVSADRVRISTSGNAHRGYLQFIDKHAATLSRVDMAHLFFQDALNRGGVPSLRQIREHLFPSTLPSLARLMRQRLAMRRSDES